MILAHQKHVFLGHVYNLHSDNWTRFILLDLDPVLPTGEAGTVSIHTFAVHSEIEASVYSQRISVALLCTRTKSLQTLR